MMGAWRDSLKRINGHLLRFELQEAEILGKQLVEDGPPCHNCIHYGARTSAADGTFRLCHRMKQCTDFSCFTPKEKDDVEKTNSQEG